MNYINLQKSLQPDRSTTNKSLVTLHFKAAIDGLDVASAQKIVQTREARHLRTLSEVRDLLGANIDINEGAHAVASSYFEVRGRLRLGDAMVDERSLVRKLGLEVTTLWRERGAFDRAPSEAPGLPRR